MAPNCQPPAPGPPALHSAAFCSKIDSGGGAFSHPPTLLFTRENASNAARTCQPHYLRWKIHLLAPSFFPNPLIFIVSDSFFYPLIFRSIFSNPGFCQLAPSRFFRSLDFHHFSGGGGSCRRQGKSAAPSGRRGERPGRYSRVSPVSLKHSEKEFIEGGGWSGPRFPAPGPRARPAREVWRK